MKLFKKKEAEELPCDLEDLNKIPKKRRKNALKLLEEYNKGIVIKIGADVNQKELMESIRKGS